MGQGRLLAFLFLFVCVTTSGCGNSNTGNQWNSFPVVIYLDPNLAKNPEAAADFTSAIQFWESRAGKQLFDYRGVWTGGPAFAGSPANPSAIFANVVFLLNPWSFASNTAGQTIVSKNDENKFDGSIVMINPEMRYCSGDCKNDSLYASQRKLFAHELGHFIGLGHTNDIGNLMYPDLQPGGSLTNVTIDIDALMLLTSEDDE